MANLRWLAARRSVVLIAVSIFVLGAVAGSWTTARAGHLPFITKPVLVKISDTTGGAEDHEVSFASGWAGCILLVRIINLADAQHGVGFMALTNSLYPGLHFM